MFRILITGPAKRAIQANFEWWAENRSIDEASRWYLGIYEAINTLEHMPERCPVAVESEWLKLELRQLFFSIGGRPTHRIVFTVTNEEVVVLAVRHVSQDFLSKLPN
jgi:plasmid stabilization system protein ParE